MHAPRYFGKSDGADAAELPSTMSLLKSAAIIEQTSSASECCGRLGKVSAAMTANLERLLPAMSVPLPFATSRVMLLAEDFLSMFPTMEALRTTCPGSRTVAPRAGHLTDSLRLVASSVTMSGASAVIRIPLRASIVVFEAAYFSATCQALRNADRSISSFIKILLVVKIFCVPDNYTHYAKARMR